MAIDYAKIGLKVGLEIHQQLNTKAKLFCSCPPALFKEEPQITFLRRLRPTQSELGQVDPAAFFEFQKGMRILYEANRATSCLVEMDEEPPHPLNMEAVEVVLTAALMMNMQPIDEVHVMRKTVIDGSNTTGFQRTCIIASDGWIKVGEKTIPMQAASLEEDAARKTGEEDAGKTIRYRIDRLGIPLIEVATAPVIYSPAEAQEVALAIGMILRDTGKVMRGLGTIRQDLNVSISNGALMEIKGVQELDLIAKVVEYEVRRQLGLLQVKEELNSRGVKAEDLQQEFVDASAVFQQTKCKVIRKAMDKGQMVLAVKLPKFGGILKRELMPGFRVGTELSDRAKFWGRVGGIFHTDEMPNYGITVEEVEALRKTVGAGNEDAVVFVADTSENAHDALKAVVERAQEAIAGVPAETRTAKEDGTTRYMRPRPGAARMYPETDIPPVLLTSELMEKIRANLPEPGEKKVARLMKEYSLNEKLAKQVVDSGYAALLENIVKASSVSATTVAAFLTETLKALKRDGVQVENVADEQVLEIFRAVGAGELAKEAAADVFAWLSKHEDKSLNDAVENLGLRLLSKEELEVIVDRVVAENKRSIEELGNKAFGLLMGAVMKEVRGKADPDLVARLLRQRLR
ncbi:Glu-tRNA(Gln) amidotransferase subunit GatE [Candidatus Bathyarchaeota archaeon A05DMB-2]|jgi:glutamyl-tRNA(Gln) amidotransferase subunit E|nr:Glu-tRNA(Gln) amidotransferase subunit GatE [Candidatus Bathyarchaeota archaeon A05DMB-2]